MENVLIKKCLICNKEFKKRYETSLKVWINQKKFCSLKCKFEGQKGIKHSIESNSKRSQSLKKRYEDPIFYEHRKQIMLKTRHPKHSGHGKKISETRKRLYREGILSNAMEKNPAWKGGISFEPYPLGWNRTFKEQVRYRDRYKCQLCGMPEIENGERLCVHHIDYNKKNLDHKNLICLCRSCHGKTDSERDQWIYLFKSKLEGTKSIQRQLEFAL